MATDPHSPNGCFQRHGYQIKRLPNSRGELKRRQIFSPDGRMVLDCAGYMAEMQFCIDNDLLAPATNRN